MARAKVDREKFLEETDVTPEAKERYARFREALLPREGAGFLENLARDFAETPVRIGEGIRGLAESVAGAPRETGLALVDVGKKSLAQMLGTMFGVPAAYDQTGEQMDKAGALLRDNPVEAAELVMAGLPIPGPKRLGGLKLPPEWRPVAKAVVDNEIKTAQQLKGFITSPTTLLQHRLDSVMLGRKMPGRMRLGVSVLGKTGVVNAIPVGNVGHFLQAPTTKHMLGREVLDVPIYGSTDMPTGVAAMHLSQEELKRIKVPSGPGGLIVLNSLLSEQSPYELVNTVVEEAIHAKRSLLGRNFETKTPAGTRIPYDDLVFEKSAKRGARFAEKQELPEQTLPVTLDEFIELAQRYGSK